MPEYWQEEFAIPVPVAFAFYDHEGVSSMRRLVCSWKTLCASDKQAYADWGSRLFAWENWVWGCERKSGPSQAVCVPEAGFFQRGAIPEEAAGDKRTGCGDQEKGFLAGELACLLGTCSYPEVHLQAMLKSFMMVPISVSLQVYSQTSE